jgi:hypothetical protein
LAFFPHFSATWQNVSSGTGNPEQSFDIITSKDYVTLAHCENRLWLSSAQPGFLHWEKMYECMFVKYVLTIATAGQAEKIVAKSPTMQNFPPSPRIVF